MKKILTIVLLSLTLGSCKYHEQAFIDVIEMGATQKSIEVPSYNGNCIFDIYSNVEYDATIISGESWLNFTDSNETQTHRLGTGQLGFHYKDNNTGKRIARIVLSSGYRRDTIAVKQNGPYNEFLEINAESVSAPVEGLEYSLQIETNLLNDAINVSTDNIKVVTNLKVYSNILSFTVTKNESRNPRSAFVYVSFTDGWDEVQRTVIEVKQAWE